MKVELNPTKRFKIKHSVNYDKITKLIPNNEWEPSFTQFVDRSLLPTDKDSTIWDLMKHLKQSKMHLIDNG